MKIIDAYMQFGLYKQWEEAVTHAMEENGVDDPNSDLVLAVCEEMEADKTDYPIENQDDCSEYLVKAADNALKAILDGQVGRAEGEASGSNPFAVYKRT